MSELSNFVQIDCAKANRLKISILFFQMTKEVAPLVKTTESLSESNQKQMIDNIQNAPLSIALLGKLNLIATEQDFSLIEEGEKVTHLTTPSSFRACLTQITFEGKNAFQQAEINMGRIMRHSQRIPGMCNLQFSMFDDRFVLFDFRSVNCNFLFVIFKF